MRPSIGTLVFLLAAGLSAAARADDMPMPDVLVKTVTLEVVDLIARDAELKAGREKLAQLIDEKVLPHFDFMAMTAHVAGPSWKKADAEQKSASRRSSAR